MTRHVIAQHTGALRDGSCDITKEPPRQVTNGTFQVLRFCCMPTSAEVVVAIARHWRVMDRKGKQSEIEYGVLIWSPSSYLRMTFCVVKKLECVREVACPILDHLTHGFVCPSRWRVVATDQVTPVCTFLSSLIISSYIGEGRADCLFIAYKCVSPFGLIDTAKRYLFQSATGTTLCCPRYLY
jgi:hypothetical protein